jgi:hypothetical protein
MTTFDAQARSAFSRWLGDRMRLAAQRSVRPNSRSIAAIATAALVAIVLVPAVTSPTSAQAFGTIRELGQRAEHEIITRIALGCAAGAPTNGDCFEPNSLDQLAGQDGTFGAVGAPDSDTQILDSEAHCDDADFLAVPGYPQSRADATRILQDCIDHLRNEFRDGIDEADDLLDGDGSIEAHEVIITPNCVFTGGFPGRAKCEVLQGLGRALHGVQDFYAHSNWADDADPGQPFSINNPPGLNLGAPSPLLNLRAGGNVAPPEQLATGFFKSPIPGQDTCPGEDGRITHACLNKDKMLIEAGAGVMVNGVTVPGLGNVSDPQTPRGQVGANALKAVAGAVIETRRQWSDFRAALIAKYGTERGGAMIAALTMDAPAEGPARIPDVPTIPSIPGLPPIPGLPGIPGVPKP